MRAKSIDLSQPHWRVIPIAWRDPETALRIWMRYEAAPYGWGYLVMQHVLRMPVYDPGLLCSELCARMLGLPDSMSRGTTPGQLVDYVAMRNVK